MRWIRSPLVFTFKLSSDSEILKYSGNVKHRKILVLTVLWWPIFHNQANAVPSVNYLKWFCSSEAVKRRTRNLELGLWLSSVKWTDFSFPTIWYHLFGCLMSLAEMPRRIFESRSSFSTKTFTVIILSILIWNEEITLQNAVLNWGRERLRRRAPGHWEAGAWHHLHKPSLPPGSVPLK